MISIRTLCGAVLMTLMLTTVALADRVEVITPGGGNAGLVAPPSSTDTGPRDSGTELTPRADSERPRESGTTHSSGDVYFAPTLQTRHFGGATLSCKVASSNTGLVVSNQSLEPLPPGTRIKWQLKQGDRGFFAIIGELGGGESLVADDILGGAVAADTTCIARVI